MTRRRSELVHRPEPPANRYRPPFEMRFLRPRFWPVWLGFLALWLLAYTPWLRRPLSRWLGGLIYRLNHKRRRFTLLNLSWCFPEKSAAEREAMARGYFRYFVQMILDTGVFWWGSEARFRRNVVMLDDALLQSSFDQGRPVLLVTCHTLALDRGGIALSADYPFETIVKPDRNPLIEWMSARKRGRFGGLVWPRETGFRPAIKAMKSGYALYILTDEDLGPEGAVFAPFFGVMRATLTTPTRIARMAGADVYTCLSYYDEAQGRYVVKIYPRLENFPGDSAQADAERMNRQIEAMIREVPEQYMWSFRLFQTRPDGEANPYG